MLSNAARPQLGRCKTKIFAAKAGSAALQASKVHIIDLMKDFSLHGRANSVETALSGPDLIARGGVFSRPNST
jgi:hypothetical protein